MATPVSVRAPLNVRFLSAALRVATEGNVNRPGCPLVRGPSTKPTARREIMPSIVAPLIPGKCRNESTDATTDAHLRIGLLI